MPVAVVVCACLGARYYATVARSAYTSDLSLVCGSCSGSGGGGERRVVKLVHGNQGAAAQNGPSAPGPRFARYKCNCSGCNIV